MDQESEVRTITLTIYGEPVPQGRPKFVRIGNHVHAYDPQKSKNYKQLFRFWATQQLKKVEEFRPFENSLYVEITFWLPIPASWSKKKRIEAAEGVIRPIVRNMDIDNGCKAIMDAGTGLLWVDDCIITDLHAKKRYTADVSRVEINIKEIQ